ncbi:MAG: ATP-dependent 6-phosphofructokinase [Nanoarchaeota archaeon]|nr:ATP-dependent 6-phosphofructokinase [Nanoarchaeota archaeon]
MKKIAVLTGGGDCPGLNNAIKQIVHSGKDKFEIEGITEGWAGAIKIALGGDRETYTLPLNVEQVRRIDRTGGTILMSSRKNPFNYNNQDLSDEVMKFLNENYYALIAIGGEDTLGVAGKLSKKGLRVVGIPKTIDKDLCGTQFTLGFDSAVDIVWKEIEILKSTAGSHGLTYFVEIMGRNAGHLTYWSAVAAGAHFVTIPEVETNYEKLFERISERKKSLPMKRGYTLDGLRYTMIIVSEGTKLRSIGEIKKGKTDDHGNTYLGGVAEFLTKNYTEMTGNEARAVVLGHIQRGGAPSFQDRIRGRILGEESLKLIRKEYFGRMATIDNYETGDVSLDQIIGRIRVLDADKCYDQEKFRPIIGKENKIYHEKEIDKS